MPFKCRTCHEHGHFQRNFPKASAVKKLDEEGWKEFKNGKAIPKPNEKKSSGPIELFQPNSKAKEVPKEVSSPGEKVDANETQEVPEDPLKKVKEIEAKTNLSPSEDEQREKEEK